MIRLNTRLAKLKPPPSRNRNPGGNRASACRLKNKMKETKITTEREAWLALTLEAPIEPELRPVEQSLPQPVLRRIHS